MALVVVLIRWNVLFELELASENFLDWLNQVDVVHIAMVFKSIQFNRNARRPGRPVRLPENLYFGTQMPNLVWNQNPVCADQPDFRRPTSDAFNWDRLTPDMRISERTNVGSATIDATPTHSNKVRLGLRLRYWLRSSDGICTVVTIVPYLIQTCVNKTLTHYFLLISGRISECKFPPSA